MKLTMRAIASLVLGLGGVIILGIGISHVLDDGSCGSGGPYAIARPCPEESFIWTLLAPVGVAVWLAGLVTSKEGLLKPGAGQVVWTAGFAGGGFALLFKALTQPSLGADAKAAAYIMAAVFIPMGLAVGITGLVQVVRQRRGVPVRPRTAGAPVGGGAVAGGAARRAGTAGTEGTADDPYTRMQQLNRLRSTGALTRAEFEQLRGEPAAVTGSRRNRSTDRLALIQQLAELKASGVLTAAEFEAKKQAVMRGA
jgi:hypothetical protein